ncbi:MAG: hypothetical protein KC589_08675 [Nanoarchaeota archaeon]|nr:hypothetical protein [Nanoarchaeota archaeon]
MRQKKENLVYKLLNNAWKASYNTVVNPRQTLSSLGQSLKSPAGVVLSSALASSIALGSYIYQNELERDRNTPISFSGRGQIILDYGRKELEKNNPLTLCYSGFNDIGMQIFEARNKSYSVDESIPENLFVEDMFVRMASEYGKRYDTLLRLLNEVPNDCKLALNDLEEVLEVIAGMPDINKSFDNSWTYDWDDITHVEVSTEEVTTYDTDGNAKTELDITYETVYDYTDHKWVYYEKHGEEASTLLRSFLERNLQFKYKPILSPSKIHSDGIEAIIESRGNDKDFDIETADFMRISTSWARNSKYESHYLSLGRFWDEMFKYSKEWQIKKNEIEKKVFTRRTYSPGSTKGPVGYELVEDILETGEDFFASSNEIISGLRFLQNKLPNLREKLEILTERYHDENLDRKELSNEIISLTKEMFSKNIGEIPGFRHVMVATGLLGGLIGGGLLGFGGIKGREYLNKKRRQNPRQGGGGSFNRNNRRNDVKDNSRNKSENNRTNYRNNDGEIGEIREKPVIKEVKNNKVDEPKINDVDNKDGKGYNDQF